MHVMIIGAAGMIGRKLARRLLDEPTLGGAAIARLSLVDVIPPEAPVKEGLQVSSLVADLSDADQAARLAAERPEIVFHLAAVVSSDAEQNLERGYAVNLDGTRFLLDAIRREGEARAYRPRLVFTSSLAVFGQPLPDVIPDDCLLAPLTSYGTQKAMCELLIGDYSRRGIVDGICLRLPTICVRPGKPNKAASGFFSAIIREPLSGQAAVLPVQRTIRHWFASPRAAIGFLVHAASIDLAPLGVRRSLDLPGVAATVDDQIEALRAVRGDDAVALIREEFDQGIYDIVSAWPQEFEANRARELGFAAETSMEAIIRTYIDDELEGA